MTSVASTPAAATGKRTILVVDDFPSVRYYHTYLLEKSGFHCEAARDGREAFQKLKQMSVDLVILDIVMPNLSGTGLMQQIRSDPALAKLPLLVISTEPIGDKVRCHRTADAGPVGYAQKPLGPTTLIGEVNRLLAES